MTIAKHLLVLMCCATLLGACARGASVDPGPDEFSVLPNAGLVEPANYSDLPNPSTSSRAPLNPIAAASVALGGSGSVSVPQSQVETNRIGGFLSGIFGGKKRGASLLDPNAEAARLRAASVAVVRLN